MGWQGWLIAGGAGILLFMALNRSVMKPLRWIWLGMVYTAAGGLVLFLLNLVGQLFHFHIPINPVTAMITGVMGVPGVLYLIAVKLWLLGG
jgi:inhibitor of the pro-sigma K processing machinery